MVVWTLLLYTLAGFCLKSGDDLLDEMHRYRLSCVPLSASGLFLGLVSTSSEYDLALVSSILVGVTISGKVDRPQFLVGFMTLGLTLLLYGLPPLPTPVYWWGLLVLLLVVLMAADERLHEHAASVPNRLLSVVFRYRFVAKIGVLLPVFIIPPILPTALGLWCFDTGYELFHLLTRFTHQVEGVSSYNTRP
ncbi:MAG: hypothetical protein QXS20_06045 [Candidatus Thorarchaeota archaeon]